MNSDSVQSILADAVKAVADAKVPDDLRSAAFEKAVDLLAARSAVPVSPSAPSPAQAAPGNAASSHLDRLAARLGLRPDVVESVYAEGRDGLQVNVKPDLLSKSKSAGSRELAFLVVAMRQAETDDATGADEIRKVVEEYNRYDPPNFAAHLAALKGPFLVAGTSRARTYKLTRPGWTEASKLVERISGVEKGAA